MDYLSTEDFIWLLLPSSAIEHSFISKYLIHTTHSSSPSNCQCFRFCGTFWQWALYYFTVYPR